MLRFLFNAMQGNPNHTANLLLVALGRHLLATAKSLCLALRWLLAATFKFLVRPLGRLVWHISKFLFRKLAELLWAIAWRSAFWVFWGAMVLSFLGAMAS